MTQQKLFVYHSQQANVTFQCGFSSADEALLVVAWHQSKHTQASYDELVQFSGPVSVICSLLNSVTLLHDPHAASATTRTSQCNNQQA